MEWSLIHVPPVSMSRPGLTLPFSKEGIFLKYSSRSRKWSLLIFEIQFPMLLFFTFVQDNQKWKVVTKNKMNNPIFVDEETIPMVHQDDGEGYDD